MLTTTQQLHTVEQSRTAQLTENMAELEADKAACEHTARGPGDPEGKSGRESTPLGEHQPGRGNRILTGNNNMLTGENRTLTARTVR